MIDAAQVKAWAEDEVFDACGIAAADPIDPDGRLRHWLHAQYHADMDWMRRTQAEREDVQKKLPGTKSVIVLARHYHSPRPEQREGTGRVAAYAWGRDYHNALKKPVRRIADRIVERAPGAETYCCIDTGPVMEKAWAMRSGVGWIGKNSLAIRKGEGSYFFLAVILTTVELEPDAPAIDQCGGCRLCIDACPTDAIIDDRMVDSRRCIAYHTIENRGEIPEELQPKFEGWIFGCDICQEVCPWNRDPQSTTHPDFLPREGHDQIDLNAAEAMNENIFASEFNGTPITRTKLPGLRRNARVLKR